MNNMSCPAYTTRYPVINLAHGGGGRLMNELLDSLIRPALGLSGDTPRHDGAVIHPESGRLAYTTDTYVVDPLFFPGGDIGRLAVFGTVNDLAVCGAVPRWLSLGMVLEEGLSMTTLEKVLRSVADAAREADVKVATGDTKVVEKGKADGLYLNTSGIGEIPEGLPVIGPGSVRPGDAVIVTGDIGRHGIAVLAARGELAFSAQVESDCASVALPAEALASSGLVPSCMRDLTRGGLATALYEIASEAGVSIELTERSIPVMGAVHSACEMLGLDPLYVANEGRMTVILPRKDVSEALDILRAFPVSSEAVQIGVVTDKGRVPVSMVTSLGTERVVTMLSGQQLPRIC